MASPFDNQYANIRSKIYHYADLYGIDRNVGIWQIWQESRFNPRVCSGRGACGIAQFIPATADRFGVDRDDIDSSLNGWGRYMRWLLDRSFINGDIRLALAGYNAGEGAVQRYGGIPPYSETENYVATIMRNVGSSSTDVQSDGGVSDDSDQESGSGSESSKMIDQAQRRERPALSHRTGPRL
ncbi:MAG: lytic transglycosylase domain-containing protein [Pyrinomonadaceae bacterium]